MATRVVYTHSGVKVGTILVDAAQNATMTINVPRENVNTLGALGTVDRPQLDVADASVEFTMIPHVSGAAGKYDATLLKAHIDDSLANAPTGVDVQALGIGQVDDALISSMTCEGSVGAMASMTMSYTGAPNATVPGAGTPGSPTTIDLVEAKDITLDAGLLVACGQSASTAWDLPIVNVVCLGKDPTQAANVSPFGNPPGTSSHTIEGLDEGLNYTSGAGTNVDYTLTIGDFSFELKGGKIDSQTNSVAVGDVFATFNFVIGGTADSYNVS